MDKLLVVVGLLTQIVFAATHDIVIEKDSILSTSLESRNLVFIAGIDDRPKEAPLSVSPVGIHNSLPPATTTPISEPSPKELTGAEGDVALPDDLRRIAYCESHNRQFNPDGSVLRGRQVPADTGKFQINSRIHGARAKQLNMDLETLEGNTAYALLLFSEQGAKPWYLSYNANTKLCINGVEIPKTP